MKDLKRARSQSALGPSRTPYTCTGGAKTITATVEAINEKIFYVPCVRLSTWKLA